jgi:hypothetical protein
MTVSQFSLISMIGFTTLAIFAVAQSDPIEPSFNGRPALPEPPIGMPPFPRPTAGLPPLSAPPSGQPTIKPRKSEVVHVSPVLLGSAGNFAILTKSGISAIPQSSITGNVGVSPIAATAMTGFSLSAHSSNKFSTSTQITGQAYAANYAAPTPAIMTTAISDMETAYTDAVGRTVTDTTNNLNVKAGLISGTTFTEGVYQWGSDINFSDDIYIKGNKDSRYIFQSSGNVISGSGAKVLFVADKPGGSLPKAANIIWAIAGYLDAGTTSHLEGVFLVKTAAVFKTGSSLNGRILAQTACTLDQATVTQP